MGRCPTAYPVEVFHDHEVGQWFYTVDALNIIGTGCPSKEAAERYAQEAIAYASRSSTIHR